MNEIDIYPSGTFYNTGTHQREPILHARQKQSVVGSTKSGESNADTVMAIIAICLFIGVILVIGLLITKVIIPGGKWMIAKAREKRELEPPTEPVQLTGYEDASTRARREAEAEWDRLRGPLARSLA